MVSSFAGITTTSTLARASVRSSIAIAKVLSPIVFNTAPSYRAITCSNTTSTTALSTKLSRIALTSASKVVTSTFA